ncbi:MAG: isoprenoid biosynthesis protein ElbB [Legionellales bacterium]|nr:isoprenoid biosynthesis protein ElbB [Legionellales bacterium]|tara:strand:- start:3583 stop:4233 length:651 start_codon:yes stop_codon:yes gene_type:complete
MTKIAVVLSGCGFMDGSEIYETVSTLLSLSQEGVEYQCFAPDMVQHKVVNYLTGEDVAEQRNVLVESARLARGDIKDIKQANADEFDGLIFPGGFGAALNLSDFAVNGADCEINPDVEQFAKAMHGAGKPVGYICIAPAMAPRLCGEGVQCTIGNDADTAAAIEAMGGKHQNCDTRAIVVDETNKVVSTPAYMLGQSIAEVYEGINKLVKQVVKMC